MLEKNILKTQVCVFSSFFLLFFNWTIERVCERESDWERERERKRNWPNEKKHIYIYIKGETTIRRKKIVYRIIIFLMEKRYKNNENEANRQFIFLKKLKNEFLNNNLLNIIWKLSEWNSNYDLNKKRKEKERANI